MFSGCSFLKSLPNISKWNTNNVNNMNHMFLGCSSLISLSNISKWITNNVNNICYMFAGCSSLISLPEIFLCFFLFFLNEYLIICFYINYLSSPYQGSLITCHFEKKILFNSKGFFIMIISISFLSYVDIINPIMFLEIYPN